MATKTRSNTYNVSPYDLEIAEERFNSRASAGAYSAEKLREKAISLRDVGQLQPISAIVRRNMPAVVVFGIGRTLAARYGIEQGILPKDWTIRYEAYTGDTDDAALFLKNLSENHAREPLTTQDYAAAVVRLKTEFGLSHRDIAAKLNRTKAWVSGMARIPSLPPEWQPRVGNDITQDGAVSLARLPEDQARRAVEYCDRKGWTVSVGNIKKALRAMNETAPARRAHGSKTSRTLKDIREFAASLGDAGAPLLAFLDGGDPEPLRALLTLEQQEQAA